MAQGQTQRVKVVRAFYVDGKEAKIGDVIDVSKVFARELKAANKVVDFVDEAPPKAQKGEKHAR